MAFVNPHANETIESLLKTDPKLKTKEGAIDVGKHNQPASDDSVAKTKAALEKSGHEVSVVSNRVEALEFLKNLIPSGASINNGHSTTLEEIGFIEHLKSSNTGWTNVHAEILAESDYAKQSELRRTKGFTVDYYLSSASAITEDGAIIGADATGTRIGAWAVTSGKLVIVSGTNKIVVDVPAGRERLEKYVLPCESARVRLAYGAPNSQISNYMVMHKGDFFAPDKKRVHVVLIKEALGY